MKFLDKFYNHADIPWINLTWAKLYHNPNTPPHARNPCGSFWWKDIIKLFGKFKEIAICHPNSRELNWVDPGCTQFLCTPMVDDRHVAEQNIS